MRRDELRSEGRPRLLLLEHGAVPPVACRNSEYGSPTKGWGSVSGPRLSGVVSVITSSGTEKSLSPYSSNDVAAN